LFILLAPPPCLRDILIYGQKRDFECDYWDFALFSAKTCSAFRLSSLASFNEKPRLSIIFFTPQQTVTTSFPFEFFVEQIASLFSASSQNE
jgi:hypothetical protein